MRILFTCFITLICLTGFSQDSTSVRTAKRTYLNIKSYRLTGIPLTKKDSLNFEFHGEETLVFVTEEFLENQVYKDTNAVIVKYEPKDSQFLETYKNIVFGNKENSKATLKVWKDDIKIYFDPSVPQLHRTALMNFAEGISAGVDSLHIEKVNTLDESNFHIYYLNDENDENYETRIAEGRSGYYMTWNGKQQLIKGIVKVQADKIKSQEYQISVLKFYFVRSLGYFGEDENIACNSYFSNCRDIRNITDADMEIIQYHYSYGICKGTNREDFENTHMRMKEILRKDPTAQLFIVHTP